LWQVSCIATGGNRSRLGGKRDARDLGTGFLRGDPRKEDGGRGDAGEEGQERAGGQAEYRQARDLPSFNVYELLDKLLEAPTLKSVLLNRRDEEYQNYRRATEKTLDAVVEVVRLGLEPVYKELARLEQKVGEALGRVREPGAAAGRAPAAPKRRIPSMLRWIYGERAVFDGIEGLRAEFRRLRAAQQQQEAKAEGEVQPA